MNSSGHEDDLDMSDVNETFTCLLYPTNVVNCSWSFLTLEKATQLSVFIRYSYNIFSNTLTQWSDRSRNVKILPFVLGGTLFTFKR